MSAAPCFGGSAAHADGDAVLHDAVVAYVGRAPLTVTGPATGRRYDFAVPGALAIIDGRDLPALRRLAFLRPVVCTE